MIPRKKLGQRFQQLGVLSTFPNTSKILLIYIVFSLLATFLKLYIRCSFEQNIITGKLRNLSDSNNIVFHFFIFGDIFLGVHNVCLNVVGTISSPNMTLIIFDQFSKLDQFFNDFFIATFNLIISKNIVYHVLYLEISISSLFRSSFPKYI